MVRPKVFHHEKLAQSKKNTHRLMTHSQIIDHFVSLPCEIVEFKFESSTKE